MIPAKYPNSASKNEDVAKERMRKTRNKVGTMLFTFVVSSN